MHRQLMHRLTRFKGQIIIIIIAAHACVCLDYGRRVMSFAYYMCINCVRVHGCAEPIGVGTHRNPFQTPLIIIVFSRI